MARPGEGHHQGPHRKPDPEQAPPDAEDVFSGPSPLGSPDHLVRSSDGLSDHVSRNANPAPESQDSGSIFDDEPERPIRSVEDLPKAVPNISDGGTEILKAGRAELQDYTDRFAVGPNVPSDSSPAKPAKRSSPPARAKNPDKQDAGSQSSSVFSDSSLELSEGEGLSGVESSILAGSSVVGLNSAGGLRRRVGDPRTMLAALAGYAIVVTLLCIVLLYFLLQARKASRLESLPDIPLEPAGQMTLIPANVELPVGHTLSLGSSQHFGNLKVEPLRVTRGSVEFTNTDITSGQGNTSLPVLKLWVRLTNVSQDQTFVPLDSKLLFRRSRDGDSSNNFIIPKARQTHGGPLVLMYHDPLLNDEGWVLKGQSLGRVLKPGESVETFLPSEHENIDQMTGDLIWRMQLRKGHSSSGTGVTTLVEVTFGSDQIRSEDSTDKLSGRDPATFQVHSNTVRVSQGFQHMAPTVQ